MTGRLVLCATPIGNLEDVSHRAERVLREADVIACEDTRRTRKLLTHLGIKARDLVVYHEGNERRQARPLLDRAKSGQTVVLVTDAGMPGLSDPGYELVRACIAADIPVEVVPGPTAAISALAISGLPPARFVFEGFLPRKAGDRRRRIAELAEEPRTLVIYESPHRIAACLQDLLDGLGERPAALVRELTKLHEEVRRGSLAELQASVEEDAPRGEITLVVGGAVRGHRPEPTAQELATRARALMDSGVDRKEALARTAREAGVPKRKVFDALVEPGD
ncbi:MAG: 16S rRNA (cytidine(1402)-2'-O)-methyltransferase [Actinobacteria bacterium]|nr:16S rRNA (cytidine(1402)-2'-O)-methyltransferase [Actinomycetota bacterium]